MIEEDTDKKRVFLGAYRAGQQQKRHFVLFWWGCAVFCTVQRKAQQQTKGKRERWGKDARMSFSFLHTFVYMYHHPILLLLIKNKTCSVLWCCASLCCVLDSMYTTHTTPVYPFLCFPFLLAVLCSVVCLLLFLSPCSLFVFVCSSIKIKVLVCKRERSIDFLFSRSHAQHLFSCVLCCVCVCV